MYNERVTVKPLNIRMKIFNTQIFDIIYDNHCKDNANMNYEYLEKNFNNLYERALFNDMIKSDVFIEFIIKYEFNLLKLNNKKLE